MHYLLKIHGFVQGVGYRAFIKGIASEMSVKGYARNMPDGSVEVVAACTPEKFEMFKNAISISVPGGIEVKNIETRKIKETRQYSSFEIIA